MSCTLEELHQAHYEMLCTFDKYCTEHSLEYVLHGGTLLGAIRNNYIIPWDDDADIIMSIDNFNRLCQCIKKDPIEGIFFQWFETEKYYPKFFAKLRKENTYMSEPYLEELDINQGVWIDLFVYLNKPDKKLGIIYQETLLKFFRFLGHCFMYSDKLELNKAISLSSFKENIPKIFIYFFKKIFSEKKINNLRRKVFSLISKSGKNNSVFVRDYDYNGDHNFKEPRSCFEPIIRHKFGESELRVPQNYDQLLRIIYGDDYMTPIVTHSHVDLENIQL